VSHGGEVGGGVEGTLPLPLPLPFKQQMEEFKMEEWGSFLSNYDPDYSKAACGLQKKQLSTKLNRFSPYPSHVCPA